MSKIKNIDGIEITFKRRIRTPLFFLYEVELTNTSDKKAKFDMRYMLSNAGINAIDLKTVGEYQLLQDGDIKKNESITGYVAFHKGDIATNQPTFYWMGGKTKVREKEKK